MSLFLRESKELFKEIIGSSQAYTHCLIENT